jgi:outer membrane murein-binding lipoprotein Lpp
VLPVFAALDITTLMVALLGGGFVTGLVAMSRLKVDKDAVVVTAAQGALTIQSGVIAALNAEIQRLEADVSELRVEKKALQMRIDALEAYNDRPEG